eukprot:403373445
MDEMVIQNTLEEVKLKEPEQKGLNNQQQSALTIKRKKIVEVNNQESLEKYEKLVTDLIGQRKFLKSLNIFDQVFDDNNLFEVSTADSSWSLTELNLCAIHSLLNEHHKSKEYALQAVVKVEQEFEQMKNAIISMSQEQRMEYSQAYNEKLQLLAIANYNLGSQHEFLKEYQLAIQRYELAINLLQNLSSSSPLEQDFKNSLKQVKSRFQAFKMKAPDRTFTNLSKVRLSEQPSLQTLNQQIPQFIAPNQRSLSNTRTRKIRPVSAQIQIQKSSQKLNRDIPESQKQSIQKELPQNQLPYRPVRQRPISSYVQRDSNMLPKSNFLTQSFTNIRTSQNQENQSNLDIQSLERGIMSYNKLQGSDKKIQLSSLYGSQTNMRQSNNYQQNMMNIQEDQMLEVQEDDGPSEEDTENIHPLMLNRRSNNNLFGKSRPISAKTQMSKTSYNRQEIQNSGHIYQNTISTNFYQQKPHHSKQKSIEKIYQEAEQDIQMIKNNNMRNLGKKTFISKPPRSKLMRDTSNQRSIQRIQHVIAPKLNQNSKSRSNSAQRNVVKVYKQNNLFDIIDESFNQLEISNIKAQEDLSKSSLGLRNQNVNLRDLYARENMIQQEIFYYNNAILPSVVDDLQRKPKPQMPKFPDSTKSSHSYIGGRPQSGNRSSNQNEALQGYGGQSSSTLMTKYNRSQIRSKKGKKIKITNAYSMFNHKEADFSNDDIKPIMNIVTNTQGKINKLIKFYVQKLKANLLFHKMEDTQQSSSKRLVETKQMKNLRVKIIKLCQRAIFPQNHRQREAYNSMYDYYISFNFLKNNQPLTVDMIIKIQKYIRGYLTRRRLIFDHYSSLNQKVIFKTIYESLHFGKSLLYITRKRNFYELSVRSAIDIRKRITRTFTLEDFGVTSKCIKDSEDKLIRKFYKLLSESIGDMHRDFFQYAKPLTREDIQENFSQRQLLNSMLSQRTQGLSTLELKLFKDIKLDLSQSLQPLYLNENSFSGINLKADETVESKIKIKIPTKIDKIIKIQSLIRGFLILKQIYYIQKQGQQQILLQKFVKKFHIDTQQVRYATISLFQEDESSDIFIRGQLIKLNNQDEFIADYYTGISTQYIGNLSPLSSYIKENIILKKLKKQSQNQQYALNIPQLHQFCMNNDKLQIKDATNKTFLNQKIEQSLYNYNQNKSKSNVNYNSNQFNKTITSTSSPQGKQLNKFNDNLSQTLNIKADHIEVRNSKIFHQANQTIDLGSHRLNQNSNQNLTISKPKQQFSYAPSPMNKTQNLSNFDDSMPFCRDKKIRMIKKTNNSILDRHQNSKSPLSQSGASSKRSTYAHIWNKYHNKTISKSQIKHDKKEESVQSQLKYFQAIVKIQKWFRIKKFKQRLDLKISRKNEILSRKHSKEPLLQENKQDQINSNKAKEDLELIASVIKMQSVFKGRQQRKQFKQIKEIKQENPTQNIMPIESKKSLRQAAKPEPVRKMLQINTEHTQSNNYIISTQVSTEKFVNAPDKITMFDKLQDRQKINEKELIYIYFTFDSDTNQKVRVDLMINNKKMTIIAKADGYSTFTILLDDFLTQYKPIEYKIKSRDDILKLMREIMPKIILLKNSKIMLSSQPHEINPEKEEVKAQSSIKNTQEDVIQEEIKIVDQGELTLQVTQNEFESLNKDELKGLLKSTLTMSEQDTSIQQQFPGRASKIDPKNVLFDFEMEGFRFKEYASSTTRLILFKDMMENIFLKVTYNHLNDYTLIERINKERVLKLNGIPQSQSNSNLPASTLNQIGDLLKQELHIRIGLACKGLEDNEYISLDKIENIIKVYGFKVSEEEVQQVQSMQDIVQKTKMIQMAFRRKKQNKEQKAS